MSLKALKWRIRHFSVYRFLAERYPWSIENECVPNTWTFAKNMNGWLIKCDLVALWHNNSKFRRFWLFIRACGYALKCRNGKMAWMQLIDINSISNVQKRFESTQPNHTKPDQTQTHSNTIYLLARNAGFLRFITNADTLNSEFHCQGDAIVKARLKRKQMR